MSLCQQNCRGHVKKCRLGVSYSHHWSYNLLTAQFAKLIVREWPAPCAFIFAGASTRAQSTRTRAFYPSVSVCAVRLLGFGPNLHPNRKDRPALGIAPAELQAPSERGGTRRLSINNLTRLLPHGHKSISIRKHPNQIADAEALVDDPTRTCFSPPPEPRPHHQHPRPTTP